MKINCTVIKAIMINDVCTFSTMDPYFVAKLSEDKTYKSSVRNNEGKYPMWNEGFSFDINGEDELVIEIYHEKETLGYAELKINSLPFNKEINDEIGIKYKFQSNGKLKIKYTLEKPQSQQTQPTNFSSFSNNNESSEGGIKMNNSGQFLSLIHI